MKPLRLIGLVAGAALAGTAVAAPASWTMTRAQWGGAGRAGQVVRIAPLRAAVTALDAKPGARLAVIHNGGEEGIFWASRVERWLVALGVPKARIADRTGAVRAGRLRLELVSGRGASGP